MASNIEELEPRDPRDALMPFITEERVNAFCRTYLPCDNEAESEETLTTADLRKYFDAYVKTCGDPLSIYIDDYLRPKGFTFQTSHILHEPVMYVKLNYEG